ncbi:GPW/gp25 family protein [Marinomonas mediterranea]|uniref:GPW/gp25 family protein n=1 Tax=Marinomonas mediterranea TaxID=119864 RepID=UPI00234A1551|nr:GPW/gp25 family protein [Marinomonas mediterranea]WCN11288.1 baseplate assembly protein [Marinomonas mediterranea]WCN15353.1 baseplate assembly protein [Marinomonas mediterranea]
MSELISILLNGHAPEDGYAVSINESIQRILTTRLGERVMRPTFGSELYKLRDRDMDSEWRLLATRYIYEAVSKWEPRVRFKRLQFNADAKNGKHTFYLELDPA